MKRLTKKILQATLVIASLVLSPSSIGGEDPFLDHVTDPNALQRLEQKLAPIQGLQAEFVQQQIAVDGFLIRKTVGNFIAAKPGKIRWITNAPFEQLVISDNDTLWIYDPDLEQVTIRKVKADVSDSPAMLFTGDFNALTKVYRITQAENGQDFVLYPIAENSVYEQILLVFEGQIPKIIEVQDSLGEKTLISLRDTVLNPQIEESQFHFDPPQGVDIIVNH
jgi:outer membrane lipoprotein carrier protein